MPNTFELIASSNVGSGGTSAIEFTSIPSTFTDLCIVGSCRTNGSYATEDFLIKFNNRTDLFTRLRLGGDGASAFSDVYNFNTPGRVNGSTSTSNTFNNFSIYIPNYTSSVTKTASYDTVTEQNGNTAISQIVALQWNLSDAINSIALYETTRTLVQHSTASLYGIKNS
jgi:hypothetical protein